MGAMEKAKMAFRDAMNAKKMGEGVARNITIIINVCFFVLNWFTVHSAKLSKIFAVDSYLYLIFKYVEYMYNICFPIFSKFEFLSTVNARIRPHPSM